METANLWTICVVAFTSVFTLLTVLAILMRLIVAIFPERKALTDTAMYAAISSSYQSLYPGTQVTKIEEQR